MYFDYDFIEFAPKEDNKIYELAVEYMALTELYDRSLSPLKSPYDSTSAFVPNYLKSLSNKYATQLKNEILTNYGYNIWENIHNEIHKHIGYSAQMWINEYNRLYKEGCYNE